MRYSITTLAAAALMVAAVPSFAATSAYQQDRMPAGAILNGPTAIHATRDDDNDGADWALAELDYLQKVCPTVLASPGSFSPTLDQFCHEPHG